MLIAPLLNVIPVLPLKCALTSAALGPVYVNVLPEYVKLPSPPASVTFNAPVIGADAVNVVPFQLIVAFAVVWLYCNVEVEPVLS